MQNTMAIRLAGLNENVVAAIRDMFEDNWIEITVREIDETERILNSPATHAHLQKVISDIKAGKNLVKVDLDDYE